MRELTPLMKDGKPNPAVLTPDTQTLLATWAVKTVIVMELLNRQTRIFSRTQAPQVSQRMLPCPNAAVWIARYQGIWPHLGFSHAISKTPPISLTTIFLHSLLFQVYLYGGPDDESPDVPKVATESENKQIWPPPAKDLVWPPPLAVIDEAMPGYLTAFFSRPPGPRGHYGDQGIQRYQDVIAYLRADPGARPGGGH